MITIAGEHSIADRFATYSDVERLAWLDSLSDEEVEGLIWDWSFQARPKQLLPPGLWTIWLVLAGRGFGKTRVGAETVRIWKDEYPIIHLIGATAADVRDVMVKGPSGILETSPPFDRPHYEPSKRMLTWPNGAKALLFSADEPERLRGPQCFAIWADELAAWRYPEAWDQAMFGLRMGTNPRAVATTTPKPTPLIKDLVKRHGADVHVTRGSSYENRANLAATFFEQVIRKYEGTRLGRQELLAEIMEDIEGALWTRDIIDRSRVTTEPHLVRVGIGVDPPATDGEGAAECGIVAMGMDARPRLPHGYMLGDHSLAGSPEKWGKAAISAFNGHLADIIVAEANNGGLMVKHTIHSIDPTVPVKLVYASRGKRTRAEPISSFYEQQRIHHVGVLGVLEDQMCTWVPGEKSPDRMDAAVWIATELMIGIKRGAGQLAGRDKPIGPGADSM